MSQWEFQPTKLFPVPESGPVPEPGDPVTLADCTEAQAAECLRAGLKFDHTLPMWSGVEGRRMAVCHAGKEVPHLAAMGYSGPVRKELLKSTYEYIIPARLLIKA